MISIGTSSSWNSYENNPKYHTKKTSVKKLEFSAREGSAKIPTKSSLEKLRDIQEFGGGADACMAIRMNVNGITSRFTIKPCPMASF